MTAQEPPIIIASNGEFQRYVIGALIRLEHQMATKAELDAALTRLQAAITTRVDDLNGKLTGMQTTLDRFVSEDATEDAAFQATIDDLKAQLQSQLDAAVASVNAMAESVGQPA